MKRFWLCRSMGSDDCGEVHTIGCLKDAIRRLREDTEPDEYRRIMATARQIGCFYCMGETPGCGMIRVAGRVG